MALPAFPLTGVIGIIATGAEEIQLAKQHKLQCVEMRPDLLLNGGHSESDIITMVRDIKEAGLRCLFTLRRHDHGGKFIGTDREQMKICLQAVSAGADIVDVEWDSECAGELVAQGVPTILSNHDFNGMPSAADLESVTAKMIAVNPLAIKMVPTATCFSDAVRMLQWVSDAGGGPRRIGFAMGAAGEFSRILTMCFGGPITYATFDAPVAPGQIPADQLLTRYHANHINTQTRVIGVASDGSELEHWLDELNQLARTKEINLTAVPIQLDDYDAVESSAQFLRMDTLLVSQSEGKGLPESMRGNNSGALVVNLKDGSVNPFTNVTDCFRGSIPVS